MTSPSNQTSRRYFLTLSLGALGVVYGDIGTSPLYALKECFMAHHGHQLAVNHDNVIGVLSLITWSLVLVISIKYLLFVLRADNRGEGGILAEEPIAGMDRVAAMVERQAHDVVRVQIGGWPEAG